eukprot:14085379-Alexandrium_andersonii.AAC.1
MSASLVGSEMCIRDSHRPVALQGRPSAGKGMTGAGRRGQDLGRPPQSKTTAPAPAHAGPWRTVKQAGAAASSGEPVGRGA